jgi:hypothetical protein
LAELGCDFGVEGRRRRELERPESHGCASIGGWLDRHFGRRVVELVEDLFRVLGRSEVRLIVVILLLLYA